MVDAGTRLKPHHHDQLRRSCADVLTPADATYDEARRLWNAIHDRRPSVIARPRNAQEVGAAVAFGREHDLEIAVQSGGHAARGLAGGDGGLVINLSNMRGVEDKLSAPEPSKPGIPAEEDDALEKLPLDLAESLDVLEAEPATRDFFGDEFISAYTRMRRYELSRLADHVSDWERTEYLELF